MRIVELYVARSNRNCRRVREFLQSQGIQFHEILIPTLFGFPLPTRLFGEMTWRARGEKALPQILIDGQYFGGGLVALKL